ncbi:MAG: aminotransferase class I/II-fold pyridoxal phosphate-dependent enzyme [Planctomycetes bacterium]|nr:aminotransferase class I/II-fold pyridoxal phosphate-dependent enzyme [Planctomycetota bacterium]
MNERIYLSPPHMGDQERELLLDAFDSNWIAPLGPHVDAFEQEFCEVTGACHAAALSSGTAAIHLALILAGVGPGDEVLVSTLTFSATINPIYYVGATPVFVDSDHATWNMDPALVCEEMERRAATGNLPKALILVHLYGQAADTQPIADACEKYGIALIEDAAEALGARYHGEQPGASARFAIYSFNGNKIITNSGGGMLTSNDPSVTEAARKLSTQAREPAPHYQHKEIGYNYRMSNLLAAVGRGQLHVLDQRVDARRANYDEYTKLFGDTPGIHFMPEPEGFRSTRWLTCVLINPKEFGASREQVRKHLESLNIEARPVWKPMHQQPAFQGSPCIGGKVADHLFELGLCLPSGSNLTGEQRERVVSAMLATPTRPAAFPRV